MALGRRLFSFLLVLLLIFGPFPVQSDGDEGGSRKVKKRKVKRKKKIGENDNKPGGATIEEAMAAAEKERLEKEANKPPPPPKRESHFTRFDNLNTRDLEKEWMEDDDEEFLKSDFELLQDEIHRRQRAGPNVEALMDEEGRIDQRGMEELVRHQRMGPSMMFANIVKNNPATKKPWYGREFEDLTRRWSGLLSSGGHTDASLFNMGDTGHGKVLVQIQRGWKAQEIMDFLLNQPETKSVTWENNEFEPLPKHLEARKAFEEEL